MSIQRATLFFLILRQAVNGQLVREDSLAFCVENCAGRQQSGLTELRVFFDNVTGLLCFRPLALLDFFGARRPRAIRQQLLRVESYRRVLLLSCQSRIRRREIIEV